MILELGIWIVSGIIFFINLLILNRRKKHIIVDYILWHITVTIIVISVFFPMPYQKELIQEKAYIVKTQTLVLFKDIKEIVFHVTENKWAIIKQYLREYALVSVSIGCTFSFSLRLSCKNKIRWLAGCALFSVGIQFVKLFVCLILNAQYLSVTIDDIVYIFVGCFGGYCFVELIRCFCKNIEGKSAIEKTIITLLIKNQ